MRRLAFVAPLVVLAAVLSSTADAATPEQSCRKVVAKTVARLYQETLKGTQSCFKTRIATSGSSTDCLSAANYDASGKIAGIALAFGDAFAPTGTCGPFGLQFAPSCADAPPACAGACGVCGAGPVVAACLACSVVELTKAQVAALYGSPPDLSASSAARTCQNALGAETTKHGRARMKEQQKCQQAVAANKRRAQCVSDDAQGKIAKASAKATAKIVAKCVPIGVDQIPSLDAAAPCLTGGTAVGAAACASGAAGTATDAIFALVSQPASAAGFVMTTGPSGALVPLPGVRVEVVGAAIGTFTDRNGAYTLRNLPPGTQLIAIDAQRLGNYPRIAMGVPIGMVGQTAMGIFPMPEVDMANAVDVGSMTTVNPNGSRTLTAPVMLTNPTMPGAALDLPTGTVLTFDVPNRLPQITITRVPLNVMPFPTGVFSDEIYSFQPEGTDVSPPAAVTFPNNTGLGDGASVDIYVPDFPTNSFVLAGTGTVTTGGTLIESDGPIISGFDWHFPAPPSGCLTDVIGRVVTPGPAPVGGATVLALGAGAQSAPDGTFAMNGLPCPGMPPGVVATVAVVDGNGNLLTGQNAATLPVFNGVTDIGDIVVSPPACGNGFLNPPEECDDGNNEPGDSCNPACFEDRCGDDIVDPGEQCDGTPGCSELCTLCGDGFVALGEECDEGAGNGQPGSGCSVSCKVAICGNGVIEEGEECDDGAANGGSFCDATCKINGGTSEFTYSAVRAVLGCGVDVAFNTANESGIPACEPPTLASSFKFGPNGRGAFKAVFATDHSDAVLSVKLDDVQTAGDVDVTNSAGWELRARVRITLSGAPNAGTLIDRDIAAAATLAAPGVLEAGLPVVGSTGIGFSPFTVHNVEIVDLAVVDPDGDRFAVRGQLVLETPALTIDHPASAKTSSLGIIPAYVSCGNIGGNSPNAAIAGVPSCAPPQTFAEQNGNPANGWRFGPDTTFTVRLEGTDTDVEMLGKGSGILDVNGNPANGNGVLQLDVRCTVRDPGGEMTIVDFSFAPGITVAGGKVAVKTSLNAWLASDIGAQPFHSTQFEVLKGRIVDPNGNDFAKLGIEEKL